MIVKDTNSIAQFEVKKAKTSEARPVFNPNTLFDTILHKTPGGYWLRYLAFQAALTGAYRRFAERYEDWVDCFFDKHFVHRKAKSLLARYLQPFDPPAPNELVTLWVDQFPVDHVAQNYMADLTPVAADFLKLLETEMERYVLLRKA
jgi:hypothetical protein